MKLFYLVSAILVAVLILVIASAQFGAACSWYLLPASASAWSVILQMSFLGMIVGGLLVLFWKAEGKKDDEDGSDE
ncbi:hypothetical protein HZA43_01565 [Candidatus Peregrinibacteria bacterium]|nr:hypothetical protein [Candidatus Peregrinibacteria bacterium]